MATRYFLATNGNLADVNNWTTTRDAAATGGLPVDGDTIVFYKGVQNIDGVDLSSIELAAIYFEAGFGYPSNEQNPVSGLRFGSADGTPVKYDATNVYIDNAIYANWWLHGEFTNVYLRSAAVGSNFYFNGAGVTLLEAGTNGAITFGNECPLVTFESAGAHLRAGTHSSVATLKVHLSRGAYVESRRPVLGGTIGGTLRLRDEGSVPASSDFTIETGGLFDVRCTGNIGASASDGTIRIKAGGLFDATNAKTNITINAKIKKHDGGRYIIPNRLTMGVTPSDIGGGVGA